LGSFRFTSADFLDADGSFELTNVPPGDYSLKLTGDDIADIEREIHVGEDLLANLGEIRLPVSRIITGQLVEHATGESLKEADYTAEARVMRRDGTGFSGHQFSVTHDGHFRISRLPDDVEAILIGATRAPNQPSFTSRNPNRVDLFGAARKIELTVSETDVGIVRLQTYQIAGRAVSLITDSPLEKVQLTVVAIPSAHRNDSAWRNHFAHPQTGEDGTFSIDRYVPDSELVELQAPGYLPLLIDNLPAPREDGTFNLGDLQFDPGESVWGVLRGPGGEPARGEVSVRFAQGLYQSANTDERGEFVITGLLPGEAIMWASARRQEGINTWIAGEENQGVSLPEQTIVIERGIPTIMELKFPSALGK
jgi:hypothetical protein